MAEKAKAQVKRERKLNRLFIGLVLASLAVVVLATVALILPPRPLQRWLTAVCGLLSALLTLTCLTALNTGINYQRRSSVSLYLAGSGVFLFPLLFASLGILLWGLAVQPSQMHLGISLPLLLGLLLLLFLNAWNWVVALGYCRFMPRHPPDQSRVRYAEPRAAYANPTMTSEKILVSPIPDALHYSKAEQRVSGVPNGTSINGTSINGTLDHNANLNASSDTLRSGASYRDYAASETPRLETLRPAGSLHSVLTMTSDL